MFKAGVLGVLGSRDSMIVAEAKKHDEQHIALSIS
jgi:hypothetical protein